MTREKYESLPLATLRDLAKARKMKGVSTLKKQELIEARNHADSLIYGTEKTITDLGDKLDAGLRGDIQTKLDALKKLMEGEDVTAIKQATEELAKASHKLAEQLYQQQGQGADGAQPGGPQPGQGAKPDDDVMDADFTEVK